MDANLTIINNDGDTLLFDVENVRTSFINALRRTILADVPTVGFQTEEYENSTLRVIKNTSSLHNEFLLHRLSLIPVNIADPDSFNPEHYEFELHVQNDSIKSKNITTKDFKIMNKLTNTEVDTEVFFPKNSITDDHILITRLKPLLDTDGEEIHIKGHCVKGTGSDNALFSPVCCAIFTNKINEEKLEQAIQTHLEEEAKTKGSDLTVDEIKSKTRTFKITRGERYYYTDENDEPNRFSFKLESIGVLPPRSILMRAFDILKKRIQNFKLDLDRVVQGGDIDRIQLQESDSLMEAYDIYIQDENHTLGYILQDYIYKFGDPSFIEFVGYMNPHPLQNMIILRIKINGKDKFKLLEEIKTVSDKLSTIINSMRDKVARELGGDITEMKIKQEKET